MGWAMIFVSLGFFLFFFVFFLFCVCVCVDDGYLAKKTTMGRCVISTVGRQMWPRSTIVGVGIVVGAEIIFMHHHGWWSCDFFFFLGVPE